MRLMPKEERFFDLFDQAAAKVVEAARTLLDMLENYTDIGYKAGEIRRLEHEGDVIVHEIAKRLNASFVTPIDREDIHALAGGLDDILDYIEATSDRLPLYKIEAPTPEIIELSRVLVTACEEVQAGVTALANFRETESILKHCVRINEMENQGDAILRQALSTLFSGELPPLDVVKWKEIYDHLETATDKCEDVANVLETVVVKNA